MCSLVLNGHWPLTTSLTTISLVRIRLRFPNTCPWLGGMGVNGKFSYICPCYHPNPNTPPPQLIKSGGHAIYEKLLKVTINTYLTLIKNWRSTTSEEVIYRHGVLNLYLYIWCLSRCIYVYNSSKIKRNTKIPHYRSTSKLQ